MNAPSPALFAQQDALRHWLINGNSAVSGFIGEDRRDDRLRIYADAYRLRLIDVLANDFPVLHALVGEEMFDTLAEGYLRAHPSRQPSVRHFGSGFPAWIHHHEHPATWSALAQFEWMQGEVFDAVDAPVLGFDDLATLTPDAWPALRLRLQPAMRVVEVAAGIPAMIEAHHAGEPLLAAVGDVPTRWLLWRHDFRVHWRRLDDDEAALLALANDGATFAELCARLATSLPEADAALRAIGLIKRWIADDLIAATILPENTTT
ncbi:DNA-binding domain-containing protein [Solilutibacter silvestris]|uniref:Putative DNA-binding domain-containing protein n=1 Tax=Solilutibacter silvestris TaxID=1645665 RepID=A0A2K1Q3S0_9GAMM|nr:putative DNA-binding domain-containing protein [Lysobacter silvestris]PNS09695.1 hypothetical protein Lysil_1324 [Lysobacter silvestris]